MNFTHNETQIALYNDEKKLLAEVTFTYTDDTKQTVDVNHTFVDDSLRGQGVAGQLMEALAAELEKRRIKAVLTCSYAVHWFKKHPELSYLLSK